MSRCRICLGEEEPLDRSPCACKGETGRVHAECMARWLEKRARPDASPCEICKAPLRTDELLDVLPPRSLAYFRRSGLFVLYACLASFAALLCLSVVGDVSDASWLDVAEALTALWDAFFTVSMLLWLVSDFISFGAPSRLDFWISKAFWVCNFGLTNLIVQHAGCERDSPCWTRLSFFNKAAMFAMVAWRLYRQRTAWRTTAASCRYAPKTR